MCARGKPGHGRVNEKVDGGCVGRYAFINGVDEEMVRIGAEKKGTGS